MALAENPRESSTVIDGSSGGTTRRLFNSFPQRFQSSFEGELLHFVDCMDGVYLSHLFQTVELYVLVSFSVYWN